MIKKLLLILVSSLGMVRLIHADSKVQNLPQDSTMSATDLLYKADADGGSYDSRGISFGNLLQAGSTNFIAASSNYVSSINVNGTMTINTVGSVGSTVTLGVNLSSVQANIPAANIAAGSLGTSVLVSSLTQVTTAGSCTNCSATFNAQGQATVFSNGSGGFSFYPATGPGAGFPFGLSASTINVNGGTALGINSGAARARFQMGGIFSLQNVNSDGSDSTGVFMAAASTSTGSPTFFTARRSSGTTVSPSATQTGQNLLQISAGGYGATGWSNSSTGRMDYIAEENFTDSSMATAWQLETTPSGSVTPVQRIYVAGNGSVDVISSATFHSPIVSNITSGQCVQTGTGGVLQGSGSACGSSSGSSSSLSVGTGTASNYTTPITSTTNIISFLGSQFKSLAVGTTNFISLVSNAGSIGFSSAAITANQTGVGTTFTTVAGSTVTFTVQNANDPAEICFGLAYDENAVTGGFGVADVIVDGISQGAGTSGGVAVLGDGVAGINEGGGTCIMTGPLSAASHSAWLQVKDASASTIDLKCAVSKCYVTAFEIGATASTGGGSGGSNIFPTTSTILANTIGTGIAASTVTVATLTVTGQTLGIFYQSLFAAQSKLGVFGEAFPFISNSTSELTAGAYFDDTSTQAISWTFRVHNYDGRQLTADIVSHSSGTSNFTCWEVYTSTNFVSSAIATQSQDLTTQFNVGVTTAVRVNGNQLAPTLASVALTNTTVLNGDMLTIKLERQTGGCGNTESAGQARMTEMDIRE